MNDRNQSQNHLAPPATTTVIRICDYHAQVLMMRKNIDPRNLNPVDRFLAERPHEQSALFVRADTGQLSTNKGCTCGGSAGGA